MANLQDIESAIKKLTPYDLAAFRKWYAEFDSDVWDEQIQDDVKSGKLDALAAKAKAAKRDNQVTDL